MYKENNILTVIIPVHNMEKTIEICLNSIVNQSLKNIAIIIVDDFSSDNSFQKAISFKNNYNNIKIFRFDKNMEVSYSRQFALSKVMTKYVTFVDADDWVDTNAYQKCVNKIIADKSDIAIYGIKTEYDNKFMSTNRYEYEDNSITGNFALELLCNTYAQDISITAIVNNKLYSTEFLKENKINFGNFNYYEDILFTYNTLKYAKRVSLVNGCFYHYYQNPKSKIHNIENNQILCFCKAFSEIYKGIPVHNENDYIKFFAYLDKSITSLVLRIDDNIFNESQKKSLLNLLFTQLIKSIPLKQIINYIDIRRIINFFRKFD